MHNKQLLGDLWAYRFYRNHLGVYPVAKPPPVRPKVRPTRQAAAVFIRPECSCCGQQECCIAGHGKGGLAFDRPGRTDLGLANPDDLLFISMIDLDIPSPEVILDQVTQWQIRVRADQISGLAI